jgi:hypothetical protein
MIAIVRVDSQKDAPKGGVWIKYSDIQHGGKFSSYSNKPLKLGAIYRAIVRLDVRYNEEQPDAPFRLMARVDVIAELTHDDLLRLV